VSPDSKQHNSKEINHEVSIRVQSGYAVLSFGFRQPWQARTARVKEKVNLHQNQNQKQNQLQPSRIRGLRWRSARSL